MNGFSLQNPCNSSVSLSEPQCWALCCWVSTCGWQMLHIQNKKHAELEGGFGFTMATSVLLCLAASPFIRFAKWHGWWWRLVYLSEVLPARRMCSVGQLSFACLCLPWEGGTLKKIASKLWVGGRGPVQALNLVENVRKKLEWSIKKSLTRTCIRLGLKFAGDGQRIVRKKPNYLYFSLKQTNLTMKRMLFAIWHHYK